MSLGAQIAGIAGKVTGSVGGGPILAVLVAAGLVTGGLVGGFAGQPKPEGTSTSVLDIYPCWKAGPAFAKGPPGQKVWVTGKNADASWYRVYTGSPTHPEGWVHANLIAVTTPASLPVVDCAPITALLIAGSPFETDTPVQGNSPSPAPTPVPTATPTPTPKPSAAPTATPTVRPTTRPTTKPTTKPTPTPPPADTIPPKASTPVANPTAIYDTFSCQPYTTTISTTATDVGLGLESVTLFYRQAGDNTFKSKPMSPVVGAANVFSAQISAPAENLTNDISFYVVATDKAGNKATARSTQTVSVNGCIR
jgi:hypothetical protein